MKRWSLNSIAARIAIAILLAILLGVTLQIIVNLALQDLADRWESPNGSMDSLVIADRAGIGVVNRHRNILMAATRIAMIARIVGQASSIDRPVVRSTIAGKTLDLEIHDAPTFNPSPGAGTRLDRLRALIEFELQSAPGTVRVTARRPATGQSDDSVRPDDLLVETKLPDGKWLSIVTSDFIVKPVGPPGLGLIIFLGTFFLLSVVLSVWTARRLARPIADFAAAAERFGTDTDASPIAERGPQELRTAIAAFNRMQERLRRFVSDRTLMIAAMSHDLRTPLTRLRLRAELIRDETQQRKMLSDLDEMSAMIGSTLAFAGDDAKREPRLLVDLGALVESICENAIDTGGDVAVSAKRGIDVTCRPLAISRAVANLVDNALKYGGRTRVTLDSAGDHAIITIDDDGPGIPEEQREKVFAPFYRIESSRNRDSGGVGLGLAFARTTAREHGGDITLASADGGGLRVRLELPVCETALVPGGAPEEIRTPDPQIRSLMLRHEV